MFRRRHDPDRPAPVDPDVQVDATLEQDLRVVEREVDGYLEQQTSEYLDKLEHALAQLDAQTAESDAWIAGVTSTASWGVDPKGTVVGETSDVPVAEDVPGAQFNAQIQLVKAAKEVVRSPGPGTVATLQAARGALAALRRH